MLNESIQAPIANAPKRGSKLFDPCPVEGSGVHNWLFKTALRLHGRIAEDENHQTTNGEPKLRETRTGDP